MNRLRRLLATTLLLALAALVSGCTDDRVRPSDELPPLPSTSASPTPTADPPGATGYPLPEEARAYTPEGARAFFKYFIAVVNASHLASDPVPLREITQGCEFCDELTQRFEETAAGGRRVVGGDLVLTSVGEALITPLESGAEGASMSFIMLQRPQQVLDATGNLISDTQELEADGTIEMAWLADRRDWLVSSSAWTCDESRIGTPAWLLGSPSESPQRPPDHALHWRLYGIPSDHERGHG